MNINENDKEISYLGRKLDRLKKEIEQTNKSIKNIDNINININKK